MKVKVFLAVIVFSPIVVAVRLLRPLLLVQIGRVRADRIGHLAGNLDRYFNYRSAEIPSRSVQLLYVVGPVANEYLLKMWRRKVRISRGLIAGILYALDVVNSRIPGGDAHIVSELDHDQDNLGLNLLSEVPNLDFSTKETEKGEEFLKSIGLNKGDKFLCFCVRDNAYLSSTFSDQDYNYHSFRNASVDNHVAAIERFLDQSPDFKLAIRMGNIVDSNISSSRKIFDYSLSGEVSDFLDLFITSRCSLFLNSGSGFSAIPRLFKIPMVVANLVPLGYIGGNPVTFIPKKYKLKTSGRLLTYKEILHSELGFYLKSGDYIDNEIDLIENTPEEIFQALIEACHRLNGEWSCNSRDAYLQSKFQKLFLTSAFLPSVRAPISMRFLRDNMELLEGIDGTT